MYAFTRRWAGKSVPSSFVYGKCICSQCVCGKILEICREFSLSTFTDLNKGSCRAVLYKMFNIPYMLCYEFSRFSFKKKSIIFYMHVEHKMVIIKSYRGNTIELIKISQRKFRKCRKFFDKICQKKMSIRPI